jgi:hypothetical protein
MLQLFNANYVELARNIPEIAEAGYDSLWLPPPYKASSSFSVGYDVFDPFDLGDKNQSGTVATMYGTKAQLLQAVQMAHRFGLRVYFDNIVNHRGYVVPGYNSSTPTNFYPGLLPRDFHLLTVAGGFYRNVPSITDYNTIWNVQNESLLGLVDLAQEPGGSNLNFGAVEGNTIPKIFFVRQPTHPEYYMDTNLPSIGGPWHPFHGTNGEPSSEDVGGYLCRAVAWMLNETKCDGFRLDAVKHVPSAFFGDTSDSPNGYCGAIQTMFDYVHGYGSNVMGNGYYEQDDNRNSVFDTEAPRNDAMIFGEHLGEPPSFSEYITRGMRLLNAPGQNALSSSLGIPGATLSGLDSPNWGPGQEDGDSIIGFQGVQFSQSADNTYCGISYAVRALQNAYNFLRAGLPEIYSDGYNEAQGASPFPGVPRANYLGEFGDNTMPDLACLQHQLARGLQTPRWSDGNVVCFERNDNREGSPSDPADQVTVLFAMNDYMVAGQGDASFDDGVAQLTDGTYYDCFPAANSRGIGLVTGFPPGSVLSQLAAGPLGSTNQGWAFDNSGACPKLLVRAATSNLAQAQATANDPNPVNRAIYVGGQTLAPGGGAIEFKIPAGSYVCYGLQWPEPSRAALGDAIRFRQGGAAVPSVTLYRHDGTNGDPNFNPIYPFKMRGRIDQNGNVIGGRNVSNQTYAIDVPILTNAPFDILVRNDASSVNTLVKLDGGMDLNSQMGLGASNTHTALVLDLRDNKPGYADDVFLGYEQTAFDFRYGPEKFAAENIARDNVTALGAETYAYTVGGANSVAFGAGNGPGVTNGTAVWVYHNPSDIVNIASNAPPSQLNPLSPAAGQAADVWVKVGYQLQIVQCSVYYTTDGSNPQGAYGLGAGTTKTVAGTWVAHDQTDPTIDWWKATIPASANSGGASVRYAVAVFNNNIQPISYADTDKLYGLNEASITNFNPTTALVWTANDLNTNNLAAGLQPGLHIVRARSFLPRTGKSSVYNTFLETFYYDAATPAGVIVSPTPGATITNSTCTIVVRADSTATGAAINIADSNPGNDDVVTGFNYGNGSRNGAPVFVRAAPVAVTTPALDALYPNLPQEFHFTYPGVPTSGSATVTVQLSEITTQVLSNRVTTLTDTFVTAAPSATLQISSPAVDGMALLLGSNSVYTVRACFTANLDTNAIENFTVSINGTNQPRAGANFEPLYYIGGTACEPGLRTFNYTWVAPPPGSNVIAVVFDGAEVLSAQRSVLVFDPGSSSPAYGLPGYDFFIAGSNPGNPATWLEITGIAGGLVTWNSVAGKTYQVLASGSVNAGFQPVSPVIAATGSNSFFYDVNYTNGPERFYLIEVFP